MRTVTSTRPSGSVLAQRPAPAKRVAAGTLVVLIIAKAVPIELPSLVGRDVAAVRSALQDLGLEAAITTTRAAAPEGTVIAQHPGAGSRLRRGATVRLEVSSGERRSAAPAPTATTRSSPATVPDVSGGPLQGAAQQVAHAGLRVSLIYVPGQDPLGMVLAQSPAEGSRVQSGSRVTLTISRGPRDESERSVPDLVGRTLDEAVATANAAGLRIVYLKRSLDTRDGAGTIVEQTPRAGAQAPQTPRSSSTSAHFAQVQGAGELFRPC
jgi:eukaryotic-like serine/threonine-protein kinase